MRPDRLRRAAEIPREEAKCLADSHTVEGRWLTPEDRRYDQFDERARESHDEMLGLAIELDMLAAER